MQEQKVVAYDSRH